MQKMSLPHFIKSKKLHIRLVSIADQIIFSVGNLILTMILARQYSEVEFAAYGVGLAIALNVMGVQRSCYILKNSVLKPSIFRRRTGALFGEQFIFWLVFFLLGLCVSVSFFAFSGEVYFQAIAVSTLVCTLIYMQLEFERVAYIKHERYFRSFFMSLFFTGMMVGLFFILPAVPLSYTVFMGLIAAYMVLKMLMLFAELGWPKLGLGYRLLKRDVRRNVMSAMIGVGGYAGFNYFPIFILASVSAPIYTAAYSAVRGIMQPLSIIIRSLDLVDKNIFSEHSHAKDSLYPVFKRQMLFYLSFSLVIVLTIFMVGENLLRLAYGEKYAAYSYLMYGWAFVFVMVVISLPIETVIVKRNALNSYNHLRLISGVLGVIFSLLLCPEFNAAGAILASGIGWLSSVLCGLYLIRPIFRAG